MLQFFVEVCGRFRVAGVHEVVIEHQDGLENPFGGPCGMIDEVLIGSPGHRKFSVGVIMSELVDVGIGLVGDPFAVAVNIYSCEGSCFDRVF